MSDFTKHLREIANRLHSLPYMEEAVNLAAKEIEHLSADLLEERERVARMRVEWGAEVAALTAQARHAEDCLEAAKARIQELELTYEPPPLDWNEAVAQTRSNAFGGKT